jgi:two-component system, chemotaxis family, protein-glutamate methylesterase/glutaminase
MAQNEVRYRVVAIGGSAGSLDVVLRMVEGLPANSGASFVVVLHRRSDADSLLAELLSGRTAMKVKEAEDKEAMLPDTVYVAPADYHLLLEKEGSFSLDSSEKVHYSRPSIDVTFELVAEVFGASAIGILLSGANADGAEGLERIKAAGGFTIAQDPDSALVGYMPRQAISRNAAQAVVAGEELPGLICRLLGPSDRAQD